MPSIAYRNLFETGTVTVDSEDADFPKENAYDWLAYPGDVWKPAVAGTHYITVDMGVAVNADFFAIHGHDVDTIKLQYSNDNFVADINDVTIPNQNQVKDSEQLDSALWTENRIDVVANATIAPDGQRTADKLITDTSLATSHLIRSQVIATVSGLTYAFSISAKAAELTEFRVAFAFIGADFNLSTGQVTPVGGGIGLIEKQENGYFRCTTIGTISASNEDASITLMENGATAFDGDGVSGLYFWGASFSQNDAAIPYTKTTTAIPPAIAPNGSEVIYREFDTLASRYWRLEVIKAAAPSSLGIVVIGEKLSIPESVQLGFSPASLARKNEYLNSVSSTGQFLGRRLISKGAEVPLSFSLLTPAYIRGGWDVFIQHAEEKPFFFAWDYANYPNEVAYCWTDKVIAKPVYNLPNFISVSLNLNAATD